MHTRSGGPTNEQGNLPAATPVISLHLTGHSGHLLEGWGDQARQANDVGIVFFGGGQDLSGGDHDAQVDHFKVVALKDHRDDVLANVMHIAFDGGQNHLALGLGLATGRLLGLDKRHQVSHSGLHDASGLHHLWQEHLALGKQVSHHVHPGHQRTFDDLDGPARSIGNRLPGFFGVFDNEFGQAMHQGMFQAFLNRERPPGQFLLVFFIAGF